VDGRRRTPDVGVRYTMTITWLEALRIASSVAVGGGFVNYATQIGPPGAPLFPAPVAWAG
jgi:hypothetical protein